MVRKIFLLTITFFFAMSIFALKDNPGIIMFLKLDQQKKATEGSLFFLEYDGNQLIEKDPPGEIKLSPEALQLFNLGDINGYKQALKKLIQEELYKIIESESISLITYLGESSVEKFMSLDESTTIAPSLGKQFISDQYNCSLSAPSEDWELVTTGLKRDTIASFKLKDIATNTDVLLDLSIFDLSKYELATSVDDVAQLESQNLESKYEIIAADSRETKNQSGLDAIVRDIQIVKKTGTEEGAKEQFLKKAYFYTPRRGFILTFSSDNDGLLTKYKGAFNSFVNNFQIKK